MNKVVNRNVPLVLIIAALTLLSSCKHMFSECMEYRNNYDGSRVCVRYAEDYSEPNSATRCEETYQASNYTGSSFYVYMTCATYSGEWKDGKRHGLGTYTSSFGWKYVGEWKDGKRHGQGTYTKKDGTVQSGIWADDMLVKQD